MNLSASRQFGVSVLLAITCIFSSVARADDDPEPPKGTAQVVGGIFVTAFFGGLGLVTATFWGMGACANVIDHSGCSAGYLGTAAALAGLGAGVGVPMIVSGKRAKKEWKKWKLRQSPAEEKKAASRLRFNFAPMHNGVATVLTYDFN